MNIVVLVSGGGTNLQALIDAEKRGEIPGGKISCVIASKPGVYALERAANAGIPSRVVERKAYPNRILNVHPALIPSFCGPGFYGMKVHEAVLASGVKLTGATVHFVSEVCDGGPIILQGAVPVLNDDTPEVLQKRVMEQVEWKLLPRAVSLFCQGKITVTDGIAKVMP